MTLRWVPGWNGLTDPEAVSYVAAVEAADGQELEFGVARAIDDFVVGCKQDEIWDAIKACCILAGARTLDGALVPLVGAAPTNNNFVSGDYDRETGLVGDGSTKYLDSTYAYPVSLQNNCHSSGWFSATGTGGVAVAAYGDVGAKGSYLSPFAARLYQEAFTTFIPSDTTTTGFRGISRSSSASFIYRRANTNETANIASFPVTHQSLGMFARRRNTGVYDGYSSARLAFYSIGESLDLEKLDNRVTRLMNLISYTQAAGLPDLATMDLDAAAYIGGGYRAGGTLS